MVSYFSHRCKICNRGNSSFRSARRHIRQVHRINFRDKQRYKRYIKLTCTRCCYEDIYMVNMYTHYLTSHLGYSWCRECDQLYSCLNTFYGHLETHLEIRDPVHFSEYESMFNRHYIRRATFLEDEEKSLEMCIYVRQKGEIRRELDRLFEENYNHIKVNLTAHCLFEKIDGEGRVLSLQKLVVTSGEFKLYTNYEQEHFNDFLIATIGRMLTNLDSIEANGSGLIMTCVKALDLRVIAPALLGGCAESVTSLTYYQQSNRHFHNIWKHCVDASLENSEECFLYAVAVGKLLKEQPKLRENMKVLKILALQYVRINFLQEEKKMKKFSFPFHIKDCQKFEDTFALTLQCGINVWSLNKDRCWLMYQSRRPKDLPRLDLFLMQPSKMSSNVGHFVYISDTPQFLRAVNLYICGKAKTRANWTLYNYCDTCNYSFRSKEVFASHVNMCKNDHKQDIVYPKKGSKFSFEDKLQKTVKSAYIGFCDFEAKMSGVDDQVNGADYDCENCKIGGPVRHCQHSERTKALQEPMTYSFVLLDSDGKLIFKETYSSDTDCMSKFFAMLDKLKDHLETKVNPYKTLHWSSELQLIHERKTECYLCGGEFMPSAVAESPWVKVADHCHATAPTVNLKTGKLESKYLGAAHKKCNFVRTNPSSIPVYIHNFMSYDSNFLLNHFKDDENLESRILNVSGLPYNTNKFRTLTFDGWKFLDSYQMLNGALATLVNNLTIDKHKRANLNLLDQVIKPSLEQKALLLQKAVYPYEWVTSVAQLRSQLTFPKHECFYSSLKNSNITVEQYEAGRLVYEKLKCKNMLEYTELYCELDTVLLAECVFEFRNVIYGVFDLAIESYISLPQLAFDACLKTLREPVEKISDETMALLFEQSIRGGISFVNTRHATVSDPSKESIMYIDANNLYGFAQKMNLPYGGYEWVSSRDFYSLKFSKMTPDQSVGYVVECDLEFPPECHEKLNDLPLAPYHETLTYEELSPYAQKVQEHLLGSRRKHSYKSTKLVTSLKSKNRYLLHYLNLQLYLRLGAKIKRIHSVIKFKQRDYLKPFIEFTSKMRREAKTKFAQDLWKLIANALYGKFIQDVRKYCRVVFCKRGVHLGRLLRSPYFVDVSQLNDRLCIVWLRNEKICLDRLYSVGFSILELSKNWMYTVWYDVVKARFGSDAELILTDTDSFVIKFRNHSKHEVLTKLSPVMDFSNFPPGTHFHSDSYKKVPGLFKDEYPTSLITEAVGVRSKCYYLKIEQDPEYEHLGNSVSSHTVCKGIPLHVSNTFPIELYKLCIYSPNTVVTSTMTRIQSRKRQLKTMSITKRALSSGDDKRYLTCPIHSVPYGSKLAKLDRCYKCANE